MGNVSKDGWKTKIFENTDVWIAYCKCDRDCIAIFDHYPGVEEVIYTFMCSASRHNCTFERRRLSEILNSVIL